MERAKLIYILFTQIKVYRMGSKINYLGDIMAVVTEGLQTALQTLNIKLLVWMLLLGRWALVGLRSTKSWMAHNNRLGIVKMAKCQRVAIFSFVFAVGVALVSSASADIYSDCEDAISRGDDAAVQEMVSRIRTFGYVPMRRHTAANICVSEGMGREMVFQLGLGQFIPLEEYEECWMSLRADPVAP
jgi:hypothetical protein